MKTTKFFVAALTALTLFSCSQENDSTSKAQEGLAASLSLKISGSNNVARATGTADEDTEAQVNRIAVLVFKTDGNLDGMGEFTSTQLTALQTPKFNITSGTRDIYVVANAPAGAFAGVANKTAFFAIKENLVNQTTANLSMAGERTGVSITAGDNTIGGSGDLFTITRLASRVKMSWTLPTTGAYANTITVNKVLMLNVNTNSTYASATANTLTTSVLGHGIGDTPSLTGQPTGSFSALSYLSEATPTSGSVYFYAFENSSTASPTKVVIEATYDNGVDTPKTVYYPITVNKANANTIINGGTAGADYTDHTYIKRNNRYAVSATIKGIGADSPWEEITPATLQLTVTVATWPTEITQAVTFN